MLRIKRNVAYEKPRSCDMRQVSPSFKIAFAKNFIRQYEQILQAGGSNLQLATERRVLLQ